MIRVFAGLILLMLLAGCFGSGGPREPHWNQDTCAHCRMALSEPRYAAQILADEGPRYYDDIGCAIRDRESKAELKKAPLFVRPAGGDAWVAADTARFEGGLRTPMGSGFGAAPGGTLSLREVEERVLASPAKARAK